MIGWNLKALRVARGLSQERLAFESGIDRSYVGRVERGTENVTVSALEALAVGLGVPVAKLFEPVDEDAQPTRGLPSGRKPRGA